MDLFNRKVIGYDIGKKSDTQLVKNALGNAVGKRGLREKNMQGSMSKPGCPYDNACVESFFAFLKKEKIYDIMEVA